MANVNVSAVREPPCGPSGFRSSCNQPSPSKPIPLGASACRPAHGRSDSPSATGAGAPRRRSAATVAASIGAASRWPRRTSWAHAGPDQCSSRSFGAVAQQPRPPPPGRHTHFGAECVPSSLDSKLADVPPSQAALAQLRAQAESTDASARPPTVWNGYLPQKEGKEDTLHRCESCAKVYRHPSCLIKHRWEHTVYWKEASKFLLSKHQQVQLLEAAAILVGMDSHATSLPEEKALWPAAVSPPHSGLLGSDTFNFDRLMEARARSARGRTGSVSSSVGTNVVLDGSPKRSAGRDSLATAVSATRTDKWDEDEVMPDAPEDHVFGDLVMDE